MPWRSGWAALIQQQCATPKMWISRCGGKIWIVRRWRWKLLVTMKLNSYRKKDQVHLLDMLDVESIDYTWPAKFPTELAMRLQALIDNPDG